MKKFGGEVRGYGPVGNTVVYVITVLSGLSNRLLWTRNAWRLGSHTVLTQMPATRRRKIRADRRVLRPCCARSFGTASRRNDPSGITLGRVSLRLIIGALFHGSPNGRPTRSTRQRDVSNTGVPTLRSDRRFLYRLGQQQASALRYGHCFVNTQEKIVSNNGYSRLEV